MGRRDRLRADVPARVFVTSHAAINAGVRPPRMAPIPSLDLRFMNVDLTPDQRAFAQRAIESGRFSREEEPVQDALQLWEESERRRLEILAALDEAEASLARGEGIPITEESMKALAEETKQRLRRRIAAERPTTSR